MKFGHEILDSRVSYGKNWKSLSHLGSDRYQDMTDKMDEQTDRISVANMRYSYASSSA